MFVVTVSFRIRPGGHDRFVELVTENAEASLRDETGCRRFDICLSDVRAGEVFLYELYDDAEAFEVHKTTPHYLDFSAATAELVEDKKVLTYRLAGGDV